MQLEALLGLYLVKWTSLHRNVNLSYGAAPHKPVLLLTLLDLFDKGSLQKNFIAVSPELVAAFRFYWQALVPANTWQERIAYPFRHLTHEGWWELIKDGAPVSTKSIGDVTSIGQLLRKVDGARFADDLWMLLQDKVARAALRQRLIERYFAEQDARHPALVLPTLPADPLAAEAERLVTEAQTRRFRLVTTKTESESDVAFVRHSLFPRVVKALYEDTCAVCRLAVRTERGRTLVDAAHIVPFSESQNDDPRNGLALCKNHHWGFDQGWFGLRDDYSIIVSPALRNVTPFLIADTAAYLPPLTQYAPAKEALAWHRANRLI
jgi:putative restriction endonuclease